MKRERQDLRKISFHIWCKSLWNFYKRERGKADLLLRKWGKKKGPTWCFTLFCHWLRLSQENNWAFKVIKFLNISNTKLSFDELTTLLSAKEGSLTNTFEFKDSFAMAVNASPKPSNNNNAYYQSNSKGRVWVNNNRGVGRDGKGSNTQYSQYSQSHSPDQYNQFSQNQAPW